MSLTLSDAIARLVVDPDFAAALYMRFDDTAKPYRLSADDSRLLKDLRRRIPVKARTPLPPLAPTGPVPRISANTLLRVLPTLPRPRLPDINALFPSQRRPTRRSPGKTAPAASAAPAAGLPRATVAALSASDVAGTVARAVPGLAGTVAGSFLLGPAAPVVQGVRLAGTALNEGLERLQKAVDNLPETIRGPVSGLLGSAKEVPKTLEQLAGAIGSLDLPGALRGTGAVFAAAFTFLGELVERFGAAIGVAWVETAGTYIKVAGVVIDVVFTWLGNETQRLIDTAVNAVVAGVVKAIEGLEAAGRAALEFFSGLFGCAEPAPLPSGVPVGATTGVGAGGDDGDPEGDPDDDMQGSGTAGGDMDDPEPGMPEGGGGGGGGGGEAGLPQESGEGGDDLNTGVGRYTQSLYSRTLRGSAALRAALRSGAVRHFGGTFVDPVEPQGSSRAPAGVRTTSTVGGGGLINPGVIDYGPDGPPDLGLGGRPRDPVPISVDPPADPRRPSRDPDDNR